MYQVSARGKTGGGLQIYSTQQVQRPAASFALKSGAPTGPSIQNSKSRFAVPQSATRRHRCARYQPSSRRTHADQRPRRRERGPRGSSRWTDTGHAPGGAKRPRPPFPRETHASVWLAVSTRRYFCGVSDECPASAAVRTTAEQSCATTGPHG